MRSTLSKATRLLPGACVALAALIVAPPSEGRALVGQPAPQLALTALDGRDMSVASARGRHLLLTFSDAKSRDAGWAFFRAHAARFARIDGVVMHNVIVPGGVLLAPRAVILARVRSDSSRLMREVRGRLTPEEALAFDRAEVRWHVDFDRRYTALFGAPPHRVTLVLVDPAGRVVDHEDTIDAAAVDRMLDVVRRGPR